MKKNVGSADRVVRIVLGVAILAAGLLSQSWWGLVGLLLLATAALGVCPAYLLFGLNTVGKKP
jgi:hypothetical protein